MLNVIGFGNMMDIEMTIKVFRIMEDIDQGIRVDSSYVLY